MEYEDINMRCRKCVVAYSKRRFRFNVAWGTGNTILTENVATAVKAEKKGFKKSQKLGLFVANYGFYVCSYKT